MLQHSLTICKYLHPVDVGALSERPLILAAVLCGRSMIAPTYFCVGAEIHCLLWHHCV